MIQQLIDDGSLILYHDYRSGTLLDLSGNNNDGVATDIVLGHHAQFPLTTSVITVADSAELQGTTFGLVVLGNFTQQESDERLMSKRDGGGTNFDWYLSAGNVGFYEGSGIKNYGAGINIIASTCLGLNVATGAIPVFFKDGISQGAMTTGGVASISADDAPLLIGNNIAANSNILSSVHAALQTNRELTATEHAQVCAELQAMQWPTQATTHALGSYGPDLVSNGDFETGSPPTGWGAFNAATLTSQIGTARHGVQVIRVASSGTANPNARQTILTVGDTYRFTGQARGDGANGFPRIYAGIISFDWFGSTSTAWQTFDFVKIADHDSVGLFTASGTPAAGDYAEFDNVVIRKVHSPEISWKTACSAIFNSANFKPKLMQK